MTNSNSNIFFKNVIKLSSAPVLVQFFSFLLLPIITRLYSPDEFGVFNVFASVTGVLAVFVGFGYHQAIVLPKKASDAFNLLRISLILTCLFCILLTGLIIILPKSIYLKYNLGQYWDFKYLAIINLLFHGLYVSLLGWNLRDKQFGKIAISRILNVIVNKGYIIIVGLVGYVSVKSLIVGSLLGQISLFLLLIIVVWRAGKIHSKVNFNWNENILLLMRYKQFPIYMIGTELFFRLSQFLVIFLLVLYFHEDTAGYYGMALVILAIPSTLFGSSVGEVYYQKSSERINEIGFSDNSLKLFSALTSLSVIIYIILIFFSDVLLPFALGEEWRDVSVILPLLSFGIFFQYLIGPFQNIMKVLNKQHYLIIYNFISLIASIAAICVGGMIGSSYIAFGLLSFSNGAITLILGLLIFKIIGISKWKIFFVLLRYFIFSLPFIILFIFIKIYFRDSIFFILITAGVSLIGYYLILLKFDKEFNILISPILKRISFSHK